MPFKCYGIYLNNFVFVFRSVEVYDITQEQNLLHKCHRTRNHKTFNRNKEIYIKIKDFYYTYFK